MRKKVKDIALQTGFLFWGEESWKPANATIDWSNNYDIELDSFYQTVVKECAKEIALMALERKPASTYARALVDTMIEKKYELNVQEDDDGNCFIQLPEEVIMANGWEIGTKLRWVDIGDGSYALEKLDEED